MELPILLHHPHDPVLAFLVVAITWNSLLNIAITLSIKRPPRVHRLAVSLFLNGGRFSDSFFLSQVC